MLPWQRLKVRGSKIPFPKYFFDSDFRNGIIGYELVTPSIFAMFHQQTTEIQPFKDSAFRRNAQISP